MQLAGKTEEKRVIGSRSGLVEEGTMVEKRPTRDGSPIEAEGCGCEMNVFFEIVAACRGLGDRPLPMQV